MLPEPERVWCARLHENYAQVRTGWSCQRPGGPPILLTVAEGTAVADVLQFVAVVLSDLRETARAQAEMRPTAGELHECQAELAALAGLRENGAAETSSAMLPEELDELVGLPFRAGCGESLHPGKKR